MGPNGSGKSTFAKVLAGTSGVRGDGRRRCVFEGKRPARARARRARARRRLPRLPVPGRDPRRGQQRSSCGWPTTPCRPQRGKDELDPLEFDDFVREKMKLLEMDPGVPRPQRQRRLFRRREEAQRDPADGGARAEARDPRRDRLRARHRRAAHRRERREPACQARQRIRAGHPLPAPAQLHRARLRARDGRRPHRQDRRQGARARAREARLRLGRGRSEGEGAGRRGVDSDRRCRRRTAISRRSAPGSGAADSAALAAPRIAQAGWLNALRGAATRARRRAARADDCATRPGASPTSRR